MDRHWLELFDGEELLADIRKSAWALTPAVIWAVLISLAMGVALGIVPRVVSQFPWLFRPTLIAPIRWGVLFVGVCLLMLLVFRKFLNWCRYRAAITSHRIVIRTKPRKSGWEIPMVNIVSVEVATGPVKRVFGVTALRIQTNFTYEPAQITGIGRGAQVLQLILEQRSRVLEQYAARQPQTQQVGQI